MNMISSLVLDVRKELPTVNPYKSMDPNCPNGMSPKTLSRWPMTAALLKLLIDSLLLVQRTVRFLPNGIEAGYWLTLFFCTRRVLKT